ERVRGKVLGDSAVAGQVDEVCEDVVEMLLGGFREARGRVHGTYTVPKPRASRADCLAGSPACGQLVSEIAPELVHLVGQEVARRLATVGRHRDLHAVDRDPLERPALLMEELDVAIEARTKPAGEEQRLSLWSHDANLSQLCNARPEPGDRTAPVERPCP